jgi:hypothetical protein
MNTRPDRPGRLDDVSERSSAQSRRMIDGVEVGRGNGIRGREKRLRSFRRWRHGENWRNYDHAGTAEQTDTGGAGSMMRVGGRLCRTLAAAVGAPQGIHNPLPGTGKQQEERDHPRHEVHYAPKARLYWKSP